MGLWTSYDEGSQLLLWAGLLTACWKVNNNFYTKLTKLLFNFYSLYTIYKSVRGHLNTTWRAAGWRPKI